MRPQRVVIVGAAGRDFHNFNMMYRGHPEFRVVAFTAAQIPNISDRRYPAQLAGPGYPEGIPIRPEEELASLVREEEVDLVLLAYSDLYDLDVMHKASIALAAGADFLLAGPRSTMLRSSKPVVSVCAVRTGAGKSPLTRFVSRYFRSRGHRVVVIRHPMPYGDLAAQAVQRFATLEDLDRARCTIEEREEYEPHLREGVVVYAGVDYAPILRRAEQEADIVLWDGGNNDLPFVAPDLHLVVADPHRAGHELSYYPGEANFRSASVIVVSKTDSARPEDIATVEANARRANPAASLVRGALRVSAEGAERIRGHRVLVIEDGPTVTHGGLSSGAGMIVAQANGAIVVDPRRSAVGSIAQTFAAFPHLQQILPSMGYSEAQIRELAETIQRSDAEFVIDGSPVDLRRLVQVRQPILNVVYSYDDVGGKLSSLLDSFLARIARSAPEGKRAPPRLPKASAGRRSGRRARARFPPRRGRTRGTHR
jgi:predicted GTPase